MYSVAIKQNFLYGPVGSIWVRSKSDVFLLVLFLQYLSTTWGGGVKMLFIPSKYFFRSVNICFMYLGATVFSICKCVLLLNEPFFYCIMISFVFFYILWFKDHFCFNMATDWVLRNSNTDMPLNLKSLKALVLKRFGGDFKLFRLGMHGCYQVCENILKPPILDIMFTWYTCSFLVFICMWHLFFSFHFLLHLHFLWSGSPESFLFCLSVKILRADHLVLGNQLGSFSLRKTNSLLYQSSNCL